MERYRKQKTHTIRSRDKAGPREILRRLEVNEEIKGNQVIVIDSADMINSDSNSEKPEIPTQNLRYNMSRNSV